jgi:hypothetical protein
MMSPGELLFFGIIQARRFRPVLACVNDEQTVSALAQALIRDSSGERCKGRGGQAWSCVDSMVQHLFIVLIGENASRRFSVVTWQGTFSNYDWTVVS